MRETGPDIRGEMTNILFSVLRFSSLYWWYSLRQPVLESKLKIQDTCGVHNLHGMPGILGAIVGAITAAVASSSAYGNG